jgi:uncharacterized protein (TIGR02466 family)
MKRMDLFSSPIFIGKIELEKTQHRRLTEDCYDWKNTTPSLAVSNVNGWHSPQTFFRQEYESFKLLTTEIIKFTEQATYKIAPSIAEKNLTWQSQAWVNINSNIGFNAPHDHPNFMWSGVYYVQIPQEITGKEGNLEFLDPRSNIASVAGPLLEMKKYYASNVAFKPDNGTIILFPSYLMHWVYPHFSETDRISVAFNLRLNELDKD